MIGSIDMRILVLGGTLEARQLCEWLAERSDLSVTLSLAGRTAAPVAVPVPVRTGGFGGASGLAAYLDEARIDLLIDATHPYAAVISANAAQAARLANVRILAVRRPAWRAQPGDRWTEVADLGAAVAALGVAPRRVFLALGRKDLAPFEAAPQHHYLIRSVDPVSPPLNLPRADYLTARGPFGEDDELALLQANRIDVVVAKNSGGDSTYGKIVAARAFGLEVIMPRRPPLPNVPSVERVEEVLAFLDHAGLTEARGV
jgi:precorrin-6A/cobalt-precorrin-6A reductase